jgi:hypothetical protein
MKLEGSTALHRALAAYFGENGASSDPQRPGRALWPCPVCSTRFTQYRLSVALDDDGSAPECVQGCPEQEIRAALDLDPAAGQGAAASLAAHSVAGPGAPDQSSASSMASAASGGAPRINTGELLDLVLAFVGRYVVLPGEHEATALALWIAHTHALAGAHATPYLLVVSPERRSGKTRLLEVVELLVANPWSVAGVSEAAMFRKIASQRPTLLLDEIDAIFGSATERTEPLRALLNAGNRPGASVARCVGKGSEQTVKDFDVYCPKLLAGIDTGTRLPDTIRDRAVAIRMQRKTSTEPVERFRRRYAAPDATAIRDQLAAWASDRVESLIAADPHVPDALNDRAADAWEPLLAIADDAAGQWPERARQAAVALTHGAEVDEAGYGTLILAKLRDLLIDRHGISSSEFADALNDDEELPFGGWQGDGIQPRGIARLLKPYGLKPGTIRLADGTTPKGYRRDHDTEQAFARYLPALARHQPAQPPHAPQPPHSPQTRPATRAECSDVADVADVARHTDMPEVELASPAEEARILDLLARHADLLSSAA